VQAVILSRHIFPFLAIFHCHIMSFTSWLNTYAFLFFLFFFSSHICLLFFPLFYSQYLKLFKTFLFLLLHFIFSVLPTYFHDHIFKVTFNPKCLYTITTHLSIFSKVLSFSFHMTTSAFTIYFGNPLSLYFCYFPYCLIHFHVERIRR
jgi:hypothetical protein